MRPLKELLYRIADEVERKVKDQTRQVNIGENLGMGADGTPTLLIDDIAEKTCIGVLNGEKADLNILSEECGFMDRKARFTLVLDPIDGTHNAVRRIPFYSISLAIGIDKISNVKYGLVRNLVTGDTFWAESGKGAFLNDIPIRTRPFSEEDTMFSLYVGKRATPRTYNIARVPRRARGLGCASLEMCMVANGAFDVYFLNYSPSKYAMRVVDIAASSLILREAKGEVFNDTYDILDMNFDLKERTNVIAVGDIRAIEYLKALDIKE